jgi:hypothetical protein
MEPGEALSTAAQIAVALAGFAGVVVAFRSKSLHEWTPRDRFRLWLLLGNALLPLFSCLFGMLLLSIKPTPHFIWNWCSGFSIVLTFPFAFLTQHRLRELGPEVIRNMKAYRYLFLSGRRARDTGGSLAVLQRPGLRGFLAFLRRRCFTAGHRRLTIFSHDSSAIADE